MNHPRREPSATPRSLPHAVRFVGVLFAALATLGTAYQLTSGCGPEAPEPVTGPPPRIMQRRLEVSGAASSLVRLTQDPLDESRPALSPNQQVLMFTASRQDASGIVEVLVSVDPATGARRTIYTPERARSSEIAWMPDGTAFVYRSNRSGPWALVRSLSSSPNSGVAILMDENQAAEIGWPSVSPDGHRIAAHAVLAGAPSIITVDIGNSQYAVLAEGASPDIDPTGERIAFVRNVGGVSQLFTMRSSDGTDLVQVSGGAFAAASPCYSPDGRWIAFVSNRSSASTQPLGDGTQNLFAIRPDGSDLTQLTDGNATNGKPDWGGDGYIYFASNQTGNYDIWRLHPEGAVVAIAPPVSPVSAPPATTGVVP